MFLMKKLKQITEEILFSGNNHGAQYTACNALFDFFIEITNISHQIENAEDEIETFLANGKAICPKNAARCVLDFARTTQFLRGIYVAILELKKRFPNEKLDILYAGSGPFATLVVPLMAVFQPSDFRVTLIDIHERSIRAVQKVFADLGFDDFVADFVQTDANTYNHNGKPHLIISETMQTAMKNEPHAALTLQLAPQLAENGIFIPQKISVEACLANQAKEFSFVGEEVEKERVYLGEIFALEAEKVNFPNHEFPPVTVEVPAVDTEKLSFMYLTTVQIFGECVLRERNSSITYPVIVNELNDLKSGDKIRFKYILGEKPHFEYEVFSNDEIL